MSELSFRPVGGLNGIEITQQELIEFSEKMNRSYIDEIIPLPNIATNKQKQTAQNCDHQTDGIYWESNTGSHGWCCSACGTVIQWG